MHAIVRLIRCHQPEPRPPFRTCICAASSQAKPSRRPAIPCWVAPNSASVNPKRAKEAPVWAVPLELRQPSISVQLSASSQNSRREPHTTINGVALAAANIKLLPAHFAAPIIAMCLPATSSGAVPALLGERCYTRRRTEVHGERRRQKPSRGALERTSDSDAGESLHCAGGADCRSAPVLVRTQLQQAAMDFQQFSAPQ
jgi:hypothetical protein